MTTDSVVVFAGYRKKGRGRVTEHVLSRDGDLLKVVVRFDSENPKPSDYKVHRYAAEAWPRLKPVDIAEDGSEDSTLAKKEQTAIKLQATCRGWLLRRARPPRVPTLQKGLSADVLTLLHQQQSAISQIRQTLDQQVMKSVDTDKKLDRLIDLMTRGMQTTV